jgi:hypothetical protein
VDVVDAERSGYFAWFRTADHERWFVQLNLTDAPLEVPAVDAAAELVLGSHDNLDPAALAPYESRLYRWRATGGRDSEQD